MQSKKAFESESHATEVLLVLLPLYWLVGAEFSAGADSLPPNRDEAAPVNVLPTTCPFN